MAHDAVLDLGARAVEHELRVGRDAVAAVALSRRDDVARPRDRARAVVRRREVGVEVAPAVAGGQVAGAQLNRESNRVAPGNRDGSRIERRHVAVAAVALERERAARRRERLARQQGLPRIRITEIRGVVEARQREASIVGKQIIHVAAAFVGHVEEHVDVAARHVDAHDLDLQLAIPGCRQGTIGIDVDEVRVADQLDVGHRRDAIGPMTAEACLDRRAVVGHFTGRAGRPFGPGRTRLTGVALLALLAAAGEAEREDDEHRGEQLRLRSQEKTERSGHGHARSPRWLDQLPDFSLRK